MSVSWLASQLERSAVKVLDASWYLPAMGRDARAEFKACRIPGAQFFDIDSTDDKSSLPHMLPSEAFFAETMEKCSVGSDDHVVCYDGKGIFSAARLWFLLRAFGHEQVSVLNGGLPAWRREGQPLEEGPVQPPQPPSMPFTASLKSGAVCKVDEIVAGIR